MKKLKFHSLKLKKRLGSELGFASMDFGRIPQGLALPDMESGPNTGLRRKQSPVQKLLEKFCTITRETRGQSLFGANSIPDTSLAPLITKQLFHKASPSDSLRSTKAVYGFRSSSKSQNCSIFRRPTIRGKVSRLAKDFSRSKAPAHRWLNHPNLFPFQNIVEADREIKPYGKHSENSNCYWTEHTHNNMTYNQEREIPKVREQQNKQEIGEITTYLITQRMYQLNSITSFSVLLEKYSEKLIRLHHLGKCSSAIIELSIDSEDLLNSTVTYLDQMRVQKIQIMKRQYVGLRWRFVIIEVVSHYHN